MQLGVGALPTHPGPFQRKLQGGEDPRLWRALPGAETGDRGLSSQGTLLGMPLLLATTPARSLGPGGGKTPVAVPLSPVESETWLASLSLDLQRAPWGSVGGSMRTLSAHLGHPENTLATSPSCWRLTGTGFACRQHPEKQVSSDEALKRTGLCRGLLL